MAPRGSGPRSGGPKSKSKSNNRGSRAANPAGPTRGGKPQRGGSAPQRGNSKPSGPRPAGPSRSGGKTSNTKAKGGGSSGSTGQVRRKNTGLGGEQVEGRHAVRELLIAGRRKVREIHMAAEMDQADILDDIVEIAESQRVPIREVSRRRLDSESFSMASQGVIAFTKPLDAIPLDDLCEPAPGGGHPFLLVLDGITDPGNLGALVRTAEAAGVTGIVLPKHRAVHITATVAKASAGAIEYVPMALVGGLPTAIAELSKRGIWTIGFDGEAERSLHQLPLKNQPVAVVLGAEGKGLSRLVAQRCDEVVSIPMAGNMESLNVSAAGALALYEVVRARR